MALFYKCYQKSAKSSTPKSDSEIFSHPCVKKSKVRYIYGAEWAGTSSPDWVRTDYATFLADPSPAINNGTGSSPFDDIMPWSGIKRVEDSNAGSLVEIPKYYYKWTRDGIKMKLQISEDKLDGFLTSPAHADRGDGEGERDVVYVGRYNCATDTYKSTSGVKPQVNKTISNFRSSIHNLGSNIWQYDYAMYWTIMMLYLVEFASWDSQTKIGYGGSPDNVGIWNMGYTDAMQYHTGTTAVNRTTYGGTQYRYIEGLWDNCWEWCDGIYFSGVDVYCIKNPANFSDTTGGTLVGQRTTTSNYATSWFNPTENGFEYALYIDGASGGSSTTYMCSPCFYAASGTVLRIGGNYSHSRNNGAFFFNATNNASAANGNISTRVMKLP